MLYLFSRVEHKEHKDSFFLGGGGGKNAKLALGAQNKGMGRIGQAQLDHRRWGTLGAADFLVVARWILGRWARRIFIILHFPP